MAFFAPGPMELLIVGMIVIVPIVIIVIVVFANRGKTNIGPPPDDLIECEQCGEWIQRRAVKCRFCDARFE